MVLAHDSGYSSAELGSAHELAGSGVAVLAGERGCGPTFTNRLQTNRSTSVPEHKAVNWYASAIG